MEFDERVVLAWIATELLDLHDAADEAGERFLAYLIDMARYEAERLCADGAPLWPPRGADGGSPDRLGGTG